MDLNIDAVINILNGKKLESKSERTFGDIQASYNLNNLNQNIFEIFIFDEESDKIIKLNYSYQGIKKEVNVKKRKDNLFNILVNKLILKFSYFEIFIQKFLL